MSGTVKHWSHVPLWHRRSLRPAKLIGNLSSAGNYWAQLCRVHMSVRKMNLTVLQSTRCIFNPLRSLQWGINTMLSGTGPTSHKLLMHFNLSPVLHIIKMSDFSSKST